MRLSSHVCTGIVERANATDRSNAKVSHVAAVIERAEATDQCDAPVNRGETGYPFVPADRSGVR